MPRKKIARPMHLARSIRTRAKRKIRRKSGGPYGCEARSGEFRIHDGDDGRIATCYLEENAQLIVRALNAADPVHLRRKQKKRVIASMDNLDPWPP